jgi:Na+-transporting methylmalonyl-CoA/oxaloacetate decarboxylase gamma subunit
MSVFLDIAYVMASSVLGVAVVFTLVIILALALWAGCLWWGWQGDKRL